MPSAKFSIASLVCCVTLLAVALATHRQLSLSEQIREQSEQIEALDTQRGVNLKLAQLYSRYGTGNPEYYPLLRLIDGKIDQMAGAKINQLDGVTLADLDGDRGHVEMLVLQVGGNKIPGELKTLLALFDQSGFIDKHLRSASTRIEIGHEVKFSDTNGDGILDAVLQITPGLRQTNTSPRSIVYTVSSNGISEESSEAP